MIKINYSLLLILKVQYIESPMESPMVMSGWVMHEYTLHIDTNSNCSHPGRITILRAGYKQYGQAQVYTAHKAHTGLRPNNRVFAFCFFVGLCWGSLTPCSRGKTRQEYWGAGATVIAGARNRFCGNVGEVE